MNPFRLLLCIAGLLGFAGEFPCRAKGVEFIEYNVTWVGVSVATMTIQSQTDEAGHDLRSIRIWSRPWVALVYPVDTTIDCAITQTPDGPCHTVHKQVTENDFIQNDTLVLWPNQGKAVWSNAVQRAVQSSFVPKGSRDLVTFFFDLREVLAGSPLQAGGAYQLVMDGAIHDLEITIGAPKVIRTPHGRIEAIPVMAESKSPTLFSRNRPKSVWVAISKPAVLFADVESRFGPVRATLVKWTMDGVPVALVSDPPKP